MPHSLRRQRKIVAALKLPRPENVQPEIKEARLRKRVLHTPCACTYDNLLASQDVYTSHVYCAVGSLPLANNAMHSPSIVAVIGVRYLFELPPLGMEVSERDVPPLGAAVCERVTCLH